MNAFLTLDWKPPAGFISIDEFYQLVPKNRSQKDYKISACESLFRRKPSGFTPIKKLLATIRELKQARPETNVICSFNVFSYSFLVGAKNYDLILPEDPNNLYRSQEKAFSEALSQINQFEQSAKPLPRQLNTEHYLTARKLLTRPSAREERRILCELLISGRSTAAELAEELSIWPDLIERTLPFLQQMKLIENEDDNYLINSENLAFIYFLLRATMGLCALETLTPFLSHD